VIPIVVVGHPRREKLANRLAAAVQAEAIVWDVGRLGCAKNHLQAWKWLSENYDSEWGVVLEDDVVPCNHFRRNLEEAVRHSPRNFLSLYLGRGRPPHRQQDIAQVICADVSYYTDELLLSTQGYAAKTDLFHCYDQVLLRARRWPIESSISYWAKWYGLDFAYTRQSLVDHIDGTTLIQDHGDGQGRNGKTALWTPDCDPSGKDLPEIRKAWLLANTTTNWTRGVRALPAMWKEVGQDGVRRDSQGSRDDQAIAEGPARAGAEGAR
jgi:hypothetical protein